MALLCFTVCLSGAEFRSGWSRTADRPWIGPEYWANPLPDWRVRGGRLECFEGGGNRNVYLLTREVGSRKGSLTMSVRIGRLDPKQPLGQGWVGFRVGIKSYFRDYRDGAIRGEGLNAGITSDGRLFIGQPAELTPGTTPPDNLKLTLEWSDGWLSIDTGGTKVNTRVPEEEIIGGIALVCHSGYLPDKLVYATNLDPGMSSKRGTERGGAMRYWFRDWIAGGTKVESRDDRAYGPILFAMHTLSRGVLTLTAQMAPVGEKAPNAVQLEAAGTPRSAKIDPASRTATFRVEGWDGTKETPYRLTYGGQVYAGVIRKDPGDKPEVVLAALGGNHDYGYPHADLVRHLALQKPDLLVFTGSQVYERTGEYGAVREPADAAMLDYLRKWYVFGWAYRDLLKDIPTVCLTGPNDLYGGAMPEERRKAVERMQTSHLPENDLVYGGISMAILRERGLSQEKLAELEKWSGEWTGAWMKVIVSPELFVSLGTLPGGETSEANAAMWRVAKPGEYLQGETLLPASGASAAKGAREAVLKIMQRTSALHIAGNNGLGATIQYGIDEWANGGWAFAPPAISNAVPRHWYPPGGKATGEFTDAAGNTMTVRAVANPTEWGVEPREIMRRSPGYGIVKFRRADHTVELADWPRWADPSKPDAKPYPGWPIQIQVQNAHQ